jgi:hypothetical protein
MIGSPSPAKGLPPGWAFWVLDRNFVRRGNGRRAIGFFNEHHQRCVALAQHPTRVRPQPRPTRYQEMA